MLLTENSESNDDCSEDGDNELISEDAVEEIDEESGVESDNENVSNLCKQ